jgi:hypothetical protein
MITEVIVAHYKTLSWRLHGGTEENTRNLSKDSQFWAEIWKENIPNMKQEFEPFRHDTSVSLFPVYGCL